jgi:hypothetical protein
MNTQQTVKMQNALWQGATAGMVGECDDGVLHKSLPQATVTSIASIYAHAIFAEDFITQGMLQGKAPIYQTDGWEAKAGVPMPSNPEMNREWAASFKMDVGAFCEYAKAVHASTNAFLDNVTDAELQEKVQTPIGEQTKEWVVANLLGTHLPQHAGEIAALKGVQGLKGLPF